MAQSTWYSEWFDSPYYYMLYKHRNDEEAKSFIDRLVEHLGIKSEHHILDLGCGRGRHSCLLARYSDYVVGLDLSTNAIQWATSQQKNPDNPKFVVGDMRTFELNQKFDFVFNFFTSFGYFEHSDQNLIVLNQVHRHLAIGGYLLIDYLNSTKVRTNGEVKSQVSVGDIVFYTHKYLTPTHVVKDITFDTEVQKYHVQERVQLFGDQEWRHMLDQTGYEIKAMYGDYNLGNYSEESDRTIILAQKK